MHLLFQKAAIIITYSEKSSKNDRNKDKLRSSSLNLLKQAKENPEDVLKKLNELEEKVKE